MEVAKIPLSRGAGERARRFGLTVVLGTAVAYVAAHVTLFPFMEDAVAVLAIVPVASAAWFLGVHGGVLAALLALPLHFVLRLWLEGDVGQLASAPSVWIGHAAVLSVGAGLGFMRTAQQRLRRANVEQKEAAAAAKVSAAAATEVTAHDGVVVTTSELPVVDAVATDEQVMVALGDVL